MEVMVSVPLGLHKRGVKTRKLHKGAKTPYVRESHKKRKQPESNES